VRRANLGSELARRTALEVRASGAMLKDMIRLIPALKGHRIKIGVVSRRLRICTHPRLYSAQFSPEELAELGGEFDIDAAVSHYLAHGVHEGLRPCALFNPDWYLEQADRAGITVEPETAPFLHWLSVGWKERIVPTPLFHQGFYEERYPGVASSYTWSFEHYLTKGCYEAKWQPSPNGRHHPGGEDPEASKQQAPLLLREMLYCAKDYDLSRTSWMEEGARAAREKYEALQSAQMTALVAKAGEIEPQILQPQWVYPGAGAPPYRGRRLFLDRQAEEMRSAVGRVHADTVVLVPGGTAGVAAALEPLLTRMDSDELLVVATDTGGIAGENGVPETAYLDLLPFLNGMERDFRVDLLLDLVRGLTAKRVIVMGSELGWGLLAAYGRQLSAQASLGAYLPSAENDPGQTEPGPAASEFQQSFAHLDWALVATPALAERLTDQYALPKAVAERLVPLGEHAAERVFALPRRRGRD
jgi:hypothetical protein